MRRHFLKTGQMRLGALVAAGVLALFATIGTQAAAPATPAEKLTVAKEPAVAAALDWLAGSQEGDGYWDCKKHGGGAWDVGITGLALLAFLDAGHTTTAGDHGPTVRKAIAWLCARQDDKGGFGKHGYEGGIAFLALAKSYYLTRQADLKPAVEAAVRNAVSTQNSAGAWDYAPNSARNDLCVTSWWLRGLIYARAAGVEVPASALQNALEYVAIATADDGGCSYALMGKTAAELREQKKAKPQGDSIALTGISLLTQQMLGQPRSAAVVAACAERILRDLPKASSPNLYEWYYCTLGLAMLGSDNPQWIHYRWSVKTVLEESQMPLTPPMDAGGSFSDQHDKFWTATGKVGQTALAAQILTACYRCPPGDRGPLPGVPRLSDVKLSTAAARIVLSTEPGETGNQ